MEYLLTKAQLRDARSESAASGHQTASSCGSRNGSRALKSEEADENASLASIREDLEKTKVRALAFFKQILL